MIETSRRSSRKSYFHLKYRELYPKRRTQNEVTNHFQLAARCTHENRPQTFLVPMHVIIETNIIQSKKVFKPMNVIIYIIDKQIDNTEEM